MGTKVAKLFHFITLSSKIFHKLFNTFAILPKWCNFAKQKGWSLRRRVVISVFIMKINRKESYQAPVALVMEETMEGMVCQSINSAVWLFGSPDTIWNSSLDAEFEWGRNGYGNANEI